MPRVVSSHKRASVAGINRISSQSGFGASFVKVKCKGQYFNICIPPSTCAGTAKAQIIQE